MEQCFMHTMPHNHPEGNELKKWKTTSCESSKISTSGGFDCNICLDSVQDPVVTLCGHLYCWPCIYKWIHLQSVSSEISEQQTPKCPVCKSDVSELTLVPLYGRDSSLKHSDEKSANPGSCIPRRPKGPSCGVHTLVAAASTTMTTNSSLGPGQHGNHGVSSTYRGESPYSPPYYGGYSTSSPQGISLAGSTTFHLVISMFGKMICARFFGDSQSYYTNPTSYSVAAMSNARVRGRVVQADRSLSRLSFFLCCCLVLCLLLF